MDKKLLEAACGVLGVAFPFFYDVDAVFSYQVTVVNEGPIFKNNKEDIYKLTVQGKQGEKTLLFETVAFMEGEDGSYSIGGPVKYSGLKRFLPSVMYCLEEYIPYVFKRYYSQILRCHEGEALELNNPILDMLAKKEGVTELLRKKDGRDRGFKKVMPLYMFDVQTEE